MRPNGSPRFLRVDFLQESAFFNTIPLSRSQHLRILRFSTLLCRPRILRLLRFSSLSLRSRSPSLQRKFAELSPFLLQSAVSVLLSVVILIHIAAPSPELPVFQSWKLQICRSFHCCSRFVENLRSNSSTVLLRSISLSSPVFQS